MQKRLFISLVAILAVMLVTPAMAQNTSFGFLVGGAESLEDGLDINFGNTTREVFFATELDLATAFRVKVGETDADEGGDFQYVQALVDYEFDEVFGSTSLFAGPVLYRRRPGGDAEDETEFGFSGGVNGIFPLTRRLAFMAELTYHWANFEDPQRFLTATGGVKLRF